MTGARKGTAPKADPVPASDPVARLGSEIGTLIRLAERLDCAETETRKAAGSDAIALAHVLEAVDDRRADLESAIAAHSAKTIAGALVAVLRAHSIADKILNEVKVEAPENEKLCRSVEADHCDLNAALYSALGVLRAAAPGVYEACEGNYYMPDRFDPFLVIEEAEKLLRDHQTAA